MKTILMSLTLSRIIAGPLVLVLAIYSEMLYLALLTFILASITDYLDGRIARKYKLESNLGEILDPIADKILLLFSLLAIIVLSDNQFVYLMTGAILAREFWVSAIREYHLVSNSSIRRLKVTFSAKIKTTIQFIAISFYFFGFASGLSIIIFLSDFLLFIAMLLTIKTGIDYTNSVYKGN